MTNNATNVTVNYYGNATRFFLDSELEAAYSDVMAYIEIGLVSCKFVWSTWKIWTSFTSKYYYFELGSYTGRTVAYLFSLVHWIAKFDQILAERRIRAAIAIQGT